MNSKFEIKICSRFDAFEVKDRCADRTISTLDRNYPWNGDANYTSSDHHLVMYFDDVEKPIGDYIPPTQQDLEKILKFSKKFQSNEKILIHCEAGVSRSTATSLAVLCQHGMDPKLAIDRIYGIRDCMWPNRLMIQLYDDILGLNGALVEEVHGFKESKTGAPLHRVAVEMSPEETAKIVADMKKWKDLF